jgi:hypothetical protein
LEFTNLAALRLGHADFIKVNRLTPLFAEPGLRPTELPEDVPARVMKPQLAAQPWVRKVPTVSSNCPILTCHDLSFRAYFFGS